MHQIVYRNYPYSTDKEKIQKDVIETVSHSGDRYGTDHVTFLTHEPFESEEAAEKYIHEHDNHWYAGLAVQYYNFDNVPDSNKSIEIAKKMTDVCEQRRKYAEEHSIKNHKSKFIGCPKCESKVLKDYISRERCPVCGKSLISETTAKKLAAYDAKRDKLEKQLVQERMRVKSKAKVMWLVKFEYHC